MEGIGSKGGRLVLVPLPYQGHMNPMLQLGTILHTKGFSITVVYTPFNPPNLSNYPDFQFLCLPNGLSSNHEAAPKDFYAILTSLNTNCGAPLQELLVQMMDSEEQHDEIVCIIYDSVMYYAEAVAKHLKLPSIILRITSACHVLTLSMYPCLQERGHIPILESNLMELIPGMHPLRHIDLPIHGVSNVKAYLQMVSKVGDIRSSSAVIWNSLDCLEQSTLSELQKQYQVPMFSVGPLHEFANISSSSLIKEDTSCIEWLDNHPQNSVLYVSLGSVAKVSERDVTEMAWGLANSRQPFLWVIRPGSVVGSEQIELLPPGFTDMIGERGYIVKWAPQKMVLEHNAVGGFWSHCGWNSTIESVTAGVPLICMPSFGDQKVNARYLSQVWKIGLQLENGFGREEIERTIRRLMVNDEGTIMRQKAFDFKKKIGISMEEGGSSYKSLCGLVEFIHNAKWEEFIM